MTSSSAGSVVVKGLEQDLGLLPDPVVSQEPSLTGGSSESTPPATSTRPVKDASTMVRWFSVSLLWEICQLNGEYRAFKVLPEGGTASLPVERIRV